MLTKDLKKDTYFRVPFMGATIKMYEHLPLNNSVYVTIFGEWGESIDTTLSDNLEVIILKRFKAVVIDSEQNVQYNAETFATSMENAKKELIESYAYELDTIEDEIEIVSIEEI